MSSDPTTDLVAIERSGAVATVRLQRPPVNAIDGPLCEALQAALDALEADAEVRGLILAGRPGLFSAGLDLPALLQLDRPAMADFWRLFVSTFLRLWTTPLCVVAAIEGHAPAGGTVLALAADHRIAASGRFQLGLNEVAVGLTVPGFLCRVVVALLGQRAAERVLTRGLLVAPEEALALGFVDAVALPADVVPQAEAELRARLEVPEQARRQTKRALRRALADAVARGLDDEIEGFLDGWFSPACQRELRGVVERLAARRGPR
jgi:enoyl-CoA hydratase/carnithine racemase